MTILAALDFATSADFWISVGVIAGIYAIFTAGLQLNVGQTGILNFGQAGFMAIGAYVMALLVLETGLSLWVAAPLGVLAAVLGGVLLGLVTLRLRADYLAIVTIAAAEIIVITVQNGGDLTGGTSGLTGFDARWVSLQASILEALDGIGLGDRYELPLLLVTWLIVAISLIGLTLLARSPWGRVLRAIREDEDAASALGKNVFAYKLQSLALAAALGAIAGLLLAMQLTLIYPSSFEPDFTFIGFAILVLGGLGSYAGVALGAVLLWALLEGTRYLDLPLSADKVAAIRFMIVGALLIVLVVRRPQGLLGKREEMVIRG